MRQIWTKLLTGSLNWKTLAQTLRGNVISVGFPLSSRTNRHRPPSRAKVEHHDPLEILEELRSIETQILAEIDELGDAAWGVVEE